MKIEDFIVNVPDFPKPGVVFKDITPLLENKFSELVEQMGKLVDWTSIDSIVGVESRGFILAAGLASRYSKGFIPVRKKGKLPPPTHQVSYQLEYGQDTLEMKPGLTHNKRVLIVDDVLATGGTLKATIELCEKSQFLVKDILVLINLKFLNDFDQFLEGKSYRLKSLLVY